MRRAWLLSIFCLMGGCIPFSLQPVYTAEDLVFDEGLLGSWGSDSDLDDVFKFENADGKGYRLSYRETEDDPPVVFLVHLAQIGGHRVLDVTLANDSPLPDIQEEAAIHLLRIHSFYYVKRDGDTLSFRTFDQDWLKERSEKGLLWVKHQQVNDQLVFTDTTERMQRFLVKWGNAGILGDWETLKRR